MHGYIFREGEGGGTTLPTIQLKEMFTSPRSVSKVKDALYPASLSDLNLRTKLSISTSAMAENLN